MSTDYSAGTLSDSPTSTGSRHDGFDSSTEVENLRNKGDLIFSVDNEIMTVEVAASQNLAVGDIIKINATGYAVKITNSNTFNRNQGYGVVIHEGADNSSGENGDLLVQIATGNAYVALETFTDILPLHQVSVTVVTDARSTSTATAQGLTSTTGISSSIGGNTQALITAELAKIHNYVQGVVGRSYGAPGQMVRPAEVEGTNSTSTGLDGGAIVVVRLGFD